MITKDILKVWNTGNPMTSIAKEFNLPYGKVCQLMKLAKGSYLDVFMDADSLADSLIPKLLIGLAEVSGLRVNRAEVFARFQGYDVPLSELDYCVDYQRSLGITLPIQKNYADMCLTVRVMELLYSGKLMDTVVIYASDSDFVPLVKALVDKGIKVILVYMKGITSESVLQYYQSLGVVTIGRERIIHGVEDYFYEAVNEVNNALNRQKTRLEILATFCKSGSEWDFYEWFDSKQQFVDYFNQVVEFIVDGRMVLSIKQDVLVEISNKIRAERGHFVVVNVESQLPKLEEIEALLEERYLESGEVSEDSMKVSEASTQVLDSSTQVSESSVEEPLGELGSKSNPLTTPFLVEKMLGYTPKMHA